MEQIISAQGTPLPAKRRVGRPAGKQNEANRIAAREKAAFNKSASLRARKILNAQTISALGTHHMLELIRDPKNPEIIWERHIVRDMKRQENFLDEGEYGRDYIIVEGTPADWRAGDAILNRAWGKPKETLEVEGEVKFSLRAINSNAGALPAPVAAQVLRIVKPEEESDDTKAE